jgi:hypothetical protein
MIEKIKFFLWLLMGFFAICCFVQTLLTLNPRLTKVEERVSVCESRVSGIEIKLDTIVKQNTESAKDIKDIYHIIMERHSK